MLAMLMFFDPWYFVYVGPFLLIAMWASARVKSTFRRYSQVGVRSGMTGAQAAAAVARAAGLDVERTQVLYNGVDLETFRPRSPSGLGTRRMSCKSSTNITDTSARMKPMASSPPSTGRIPTSCC